MSGNKIKANETFDTWAEFDYHLKAYCKAHNVNYVVSSSKLVGWANQRLPKGEKPYAEELKYKYVYFNCKQGPQRKSESTGGRPIQSTLKKNCLSKLWVDADQGNPQKLRISKFVSEHNDHPTTAEYVQHMPERRRLDAAEQEDAINLLVHARGKSSAVKKFLRQKTGKAVTCRDLTNLKQKHNMETLAGKTDVEDVVAELEKMLKDDPGSKYIIGYKDVESGNNQEKKEIAYIYFQTSSMKHSIENFPEVIGMDTTHKLNKNNMNLVVMQCTDNHGNGRVVAYCLIARETKEILQATLQHFKDVNPEAAAKVKTVLCDKDYKEIGGIRSVLPHAEVHLCHVHVMRVFKKEISEKKEKDQKQISNIMLKMCKSGNRAEFDKHYETLKKVSSDRFLTYFDNNWKDIDEAWVLYVRNTSLTLGIHTTNTVESHNGKIKAMTSKCMTIGECIRSLLALELDRTFESSYKDFKLLSTTTYLANSSDEVVALIFKTFAYWPARLLLDEWQACKGMTRLNLMDDSSAKSCSCNFSRKFDLKHCQHIFWVRKDSGLPILDTTDIRARWLRPTHQENKNNDEVSNQGTNEGGSVVNLQPLPNRHDRTKTSGRFNEVNDVCKELASLISMTGGNQYQDRLNVLRSLLELYLSGKEATVSNKSDEELLVRSQNRKDDPLPSESVLLGLEDIHCEKCHQLLERKVCKTGNFGNMERWYMACPKRCGPYRWCKCPYCDTSNVRVGHHCPSMPLDDDLFEEEQFNLSRASTSVKDGVPDLDIGIDALLRTDDVHSNHSVQSLGTSPHYEQTFIDSNSQNADENRLEHEETHSLSHKSGSMNNDADENRLEHEHKQETCPSSISSLSELSFRSGISSFTVNDDAADKMEYDNDKSHTSIFGQVNNQDFTQFLRDHRLEDSQRISEDGSHIGTDEDTISCITDKVVMEPKFKKRHDRCSLIPDSDVQVTATGWSVKTQDVHKKAAGLMYDVRRNKPSCKIANCDKGAPPCKHLYLCDCPDFCNPCKHIFKVYTLENCNSMVQVSVPPSKSVGTGPTTVVTGISNLKNLKGSLVLPPAPRVKGNPHVDKTRSWKKTKKTSQADTWDHHQSNNVEIDRFTHSGTVTEVAERQQNAEMSGQQTSPILGKNRRPPGRAPNIFKNRIESNKNVEVLPSPILRQKAVQKANKEDIPANLPNNNDVVMPPNSAPNKEDIPIANLPNNNDVVKPPTSAPNDFQKANKEDIPLANLPKNNDVKPPTSAPNDHAVLPWEETRPFPMTNTNSVYMVNNHSLTVIDFDSCKGLLTDLAIDAFMTLLPEYCRDASVFSLNVLALKYLKYHHELLKRAAKEYLLFKDFWLCPSSLNNDHWILIVVLTKAKEIVVLDSTNKRGDISTTLGERIKQVRLLIEISHRQCFNKEVEWSQWKLRILNDLAHQTNSIDCGIYVCVWAYCIFKELCPSQRIAKKTDRVRSWVANRLFENATMKKIEKPVIMDKGNGQGNDPDIIFQYDQADKIVEQKKVQQPWEKFRTQLKILKMNSSDKFLQNIIKNLWRATETECGAPLGCKGSTAQMIYCGPCNEYFHQVCVYDSRGRPGKNEIYMCPQHVRHGQTRTRTVLAPKKSF